EKILANNEVYTELSKMMADGQTIFKDKDAILKQFTLVDLLNLVSGAGTAGVRGTVLNATNNKAIPEVTITVDETGNAAVSDDVGKYEISPMASGDYTLIISADGFQTQTIAHKVLIGTISTLNITLNPNAVTV
ncbi:MAG: carboxypeptidase-like regulatory domain-containing protein, partial [Chitinophagaceae bacterium]|nr:carboxypeptidase-like regulatory domain-containing protein [Chitinophagaceae bacterium]